MASPASSAVCYSSGKMVNADTATHAGATGGTPLTPGLRKARSRAARTWRAIGLSCTLYLLPLTGSFECLLEPRIWSLILLFVVVDWMQPPVTKDADRSDYQDAHSTPVVLTAAALSHVAPVIEWGYFQPATRAPQPAVLAAGAAMLLSGALLRLWAMHTLGIFFSGFVVTSDSQALIRNGPYRWLRHPSYTGAGLMLLGATLLLEAPYSFGLALLLLGSAYAYRIRVEEAALAVRFGVQYSSYAQATKRLVPFVW